VCSRSACGREARVRKAIGGGFAIIYVPIRGEDAGDDIAFDQQAPAVPELVVAPLLGPEMLARTCSGQENPGGFAKWYQGALQAGWSNCN
jgi:hypothetical protein